MPLLQDRKFHQEYSHFPREAYLQFHPAIKTAYENGDINEMMEAQIKEALKDPAKADQFIKEIAEQATGAVAQGAERIAWTTGEQQNERYDLSKQVDEIGCHQFLGVYLLISPHY